MNNEKVINIGKKSFINILIILFGLIVVAGILTRVIPQGSYDESFNFTYIKGGEKLAVWKIILAPFLILGTDDAFSVLGISLFLLIVGGIFQAISDNKGLAVIVKSLVKRFRHHKVIMMRIIVFVLMLFSSICGTFEEAVVLLPIMMVLSLALGWDVNIALGMCLLSMGLGYGAGTLNPYSIGIPAELAGANMLSGLWFRFLAFGITYIVLIFFLERHIKKIEKKDATNESKIDEIIAHEYKDESRILKIYAIFFLGVIISILLSAIFSILYDFNGMIIILGYFLFAGVITNFLASRDIKKTLMSFSKGFLSALPALVMILLASSVKYIIAEGQIIDTMIHALAELMQQTGNYWGILLIFVLIIILEFFISSSTAKAILVMAIIGPLSVLIGLSAEISVLAYAYGDGFTNVLFPTSPVLLICLSMSGMTYRGWIKWTRNLFMIIFLLNIAYLLLAVLMHY